VATKRNAEDLGGRHKHEEERLLLECLVPYFNIP
jgi:hypothetical protein